MYHVKKFCAIIFYVLCLRLNQLKESKVKSKNTGGPAFPVHPEVNTVKDTAWLGMTLRDYFAAKAMEGMILKYPITEADARKKIAAAAFRMADTMLETRNAAQ
jgi:hypothetical protein